MSRTPLFAMTSDWHLQEGAWKRANTPKDDSYFALRQIVRCCMERDLDVLAPGDLFDDLKPDTAVIEKAFNECENLRRANRRLVFTQGQHEKAHPPYLSLHPYPIHAHRKVVTVRGISVYGMDHVPADQLETEIDKIPTGIDLLMCHQVWNDFMGVGYEGNLSTLSKAGGPGVILTGDYHSHEVAEVDGLKVYSPGSTCLQDISESREKAFFVFYDDFTVESIPLLTRPVRDFVIDGQASLAALLNTIDFWLAPDERLPPEVQKPVFYIQCGRVEEAYKRITRAIGDRAFVFWKSLAADAGDTIYSEADAARAVPRGLEGCLPLVTEPGGPVYNSVLRLLRAPDKKTELAVMAAEFGR